MSRMAANSKSLRRETAMCLVVGIGFVAPFSLRLCLRRADCVTYIRPATGLVRDACVHVSQGISANIASGITCGRIARGRDILCLMIAFCVTGGTEESLAGDTLRRSHHDNNGSDKKAHRPTEICPRKGREGLSSFAVALLRRMDAPPSLNQWAEAYPTSLNKTKILHFFKELVFLDGLDYIGLAAFPK